MVSPIQPESDIERAIVSDPRWIAGAAWGEPRPGHPEGRVELHIADVLRNLEEMRLAGDARAKLRLVALVHDSFKNEVDYTQPKTGPNHHATIARRFVEGFTDDQDVLEITELHDEAYNSWGIGHRRGDWDRATSRAERLIQRLGPRLDLYLAFYRADNASGDKWSDPLEWFEKLAATAGAPDEP
jgi:hypothetical protein